MAPVLELDRQTASFVRQLEEQRKLEKTLLVERVRGTKEGLESVFSDIKSRVAVLEKLNGSASASCIAPIGWSKLIFTGADSVSAPNTIGFGDRDETLCKLDQIKYLEDTHYLRLAANPHYVEHVLPNKSVQARVGANPSLWDTLGYVHVGYTTLLQIPASMEPTTVSIMSRVNTLFNWVETNAVGDEWYAHVSAAARFARVYRGCRRALDVPVGYRDFQVRIVQVKITACADFRRDALDASRSPDSVDQRKIDGPIRIVADVRVLLDWS